jgi:hypothetical protein
MLKYYPAKLQ